jgi:hypothetical protein
VSKLKAKGSRGSWFAEVDGERLPCVHEHWARKWPDYNDPGIKPGGRKENEYIDAIKNGTVILTTDDVVSQEPFRFSRTGYVAIYTVEDVTADDSGISFRFVSRTNNLL